MARLMEITRVGMLATDPKLSVSPTGAAVARFTAAANDARYDPVTRKRADKGATFLRCPIGCQAAGNVVESLAQGARVLVTGVLRQRAGEATDGDQRYADEVDATEVGASLTWVTVKVTQALRSSTSSVRSGGNDTLTQACLARWCRPPMTAAGRGHHSSPPLTRSAPTDALPPR